MPDTLPTLLGHENRITKLEEWRDRQEAAKAAAPPPAGHTSKIFELLLSPPFMKLTGAAILFGAGYKLEAGAIISRLLQ